jgi:hypothetical protein
VERERERESTCTVVSKCIVERGKVTDLLAKRSSPTTWATKRERERERESVVSTNKTVRWADNNYIAEEERRVTQEG